MAYKRRRQTKSPKFKNCTNSDFLTGEFCRERERERERKKEGKKEKKKARTAHYHLLKFYSSPTSHRDWYPAKCIKTSTDSPNATLVVELPKPRPQPSSLERFTTNSERDAARPLPEKEEMQYKFILSVGSSFFIFFINKHNNM